MIDVNDFKPYAQALGELQAAEAALALAQSRRDQVEGILNSPDASGGQRPSPLDQVRAILSGDEPESTTQQINELRREWRTLTDRIGVLDRNMEAMRARVERERQQAAASALRLKDTADLFKRLDQCLTATLKAKDECAARLAELAAGGFGLGSVNAWMLLPGGDAHDGQGLDNLVKDWRRDALSRVTGR